MYDRIWALLMKNQMNKREFAEKLGISSGNLSDWANGRSNPGLTKMLKIADYFGVSMDWLLERDDRYPTSDPNEYELLRTYAKLDDQGKAIVLGTAYQQAQRCGISEPQQPKEGDNE